MYLCVNKTILNIFGYYESKEMQDVVYICYLNMARSGLLALEFYDPKSKKWGQAHVQARYAILKIMIQAGLVVIKEKDDGTDLFIQLDRSKIHDQGVAAIGDFLQKLNVYKATADAKAGIAFYDEATHVPKSWHSYRDIVLAQKQPRKIFVQGNTMIDESGEVILKEYPLTYAGLIESFIERNV